MAGRELLASKNVAGAAVSPLAECSPGAHWLEEGRMGWTTLGGQEKL